MIREANADIALRCGVVFGGLSRAGREGEMIGRVPGSPFTGSGLLSSETLEADVSLSLLIRGGCSSNWSQHTL